MNKEETLALWQQGKDAWNAWAEKMLAHRAGMERDGTWASSRNVLGHEGPGNEATAGWMDEAAADFEGQAFEAVADFRGFLFPGAAKFENATFEQVAGFDRATFSGDAWFASATFSEDAWFTSAAFSGDGQFKSATFSRNAGFGGVTFEGAAQFENVKFSGDAQFYSARFCGGAWFMRVAFSGYARFDRATFSGTAGFALASFEGYTSFHRATFRRLADFSAAQGERAFSLDSASFDEVPDFIQAHFSEAPRLDNVSIPEVGGIVRFFLPMRPGIDAGPALSARYRALKRLAIEAHDQARELDYSANELKAQRGHPDRLLPCPFNLFRKDEKGERLPLWPGGLRGTMRFWFGLGYEALSDFGRSMALPLVWWVLATLGFAWAYHDRARFADGCAAGAGMPLDAAMTPWSAALGLSIRKALPFAGIASSEKLNQIYACLYGIHGQAAQTGPGTELTPGFTPVIPDAVDYLGMGQLVLSILLLFLFLLAVRSHFRIR